MAKRLTDTAKWDKSWYRKLGSRLRDIRQYVLDRCDHAGLIENDLETFEHYIGSPVKFEEIELAFRGKITLVGAEIFIPAFIEFQYKCSINELNPENKVHRSVIEILKNKGLARGLQGAKDKDKDKDKDKRESFKIMYQEYKTMVSAVKGKSITKGPDAEKRFMHQVKTDEDLTSFSVAIKNYKGMLEDTSWRDAKTSFETFIGGNKKPFWKEWVDYEPTKKEPEGFNKDDWMQL